MQGQGLRFFHKDLMFKVITIWLFIWYFAFLGPSSCGHYGRIASIVDSLGIFGLKNVNGGCVS